MHEIGYALIINYINDLMVFYLPAMCILTPRRGKEIRDMDRFFNAPYGMDSSFPLCNGIFCSDLSSPLWPGGFCGAVGAFLQGQPETETCAACVHFFDRNTRRYDSAAMYACLNTGSN